MKFILTYLNNLLEWKKIVWHCRLFYLIFRSASIKVFFFHFRSNNFSFGRLTLPYPRIIKWDILKRLNQCFFMPCLHIPKHEGLLKNTLINIIRSQSVFLTCQGKPPWSVSWDLNKGQQFKMALYKHL